MCSLTAVCLWGGNSIFSYEGFPIQYYGRDVYSLGMGDTGSSDIFRYNTGYANPAQNNQDNKTLFGTGMIFGYTNYKSKTDGVQQSFRDDALDFPYFSVSVPIKKHRIGFQFMSHANGVVKNQTLIDENTFERQEADKYIYRADLLYSYRINNLRLGVSANYFLGHSNRVFEQTSSQNTMPTTESLHQSFKNPTFSLGMVQSVKDHAVGAYATFPVRLDGEQTWSSFHSSAETQATHYDLPLLIGLGYAGLVLPELKVSADYTYESFKETDNNLRDGWKAGLGIAYEPEIDRKKHWYQKIPVRAGYSMRLLPFKCNGEYVDENTLSAGISIPLKSDVNRLDLGFQYTTRGVLDTHNLQDSSYLFLIGFTGFDIIGKAIDRTAPREIPKAEEIQQW